MTEVIEDGGKDDLVISERVQVSGMHILIRRHKEAIFSFIFYVCGLYVFIDTGCVV